MGHVNRRPREAEEPNLQQELHILRVIEILIGRRLVGTESLDQSLDLILLQKCRINVEVPKHLDQLRQTDYLLILLYLIKKLLIMLFQAEALVGVFLEQILPYASVFGHKLDDYFSFAIFLIVNIY